MIYGLGFTTGASFRVISKMFRDPQFGQRIMRSNLREFSSRTSATNRFAFPQFGHETEAVGSLPRRIPAASQAFAATGSFQAMVFVTANMQNISVQRQKHL
jgi:hypothetical protein